MTTNDGRLRLNVPRPKLTHDPRLGRAKKNDPVWIASVAWKCSLLSVDIDRIRQTSSIRSRRCGNRSLTIVPHLPPGLNSHIGRTRGVLESDSPPPTPSVLPSAANSFGLGSNVSMCDTPPVENRRMTRLAFAAKCGFFGASGSDE